MVAEKHRLDEFDKLENYLKENEIKYYRRDINDPSKMERHQLMVMRHGKLWWDAICQPSSYGWEEGLLEVMGKPVVRKTDGDTVKGYLTAQEVIDRYEEFINNKEN